MKKFVLLTLALAMVFSMAACGCDHQWQNATCEVPKTCSLCGETEGELAAHTPGELAIAAVNTDELTITHNLPCRVCGEIIETKTSSTGTSPVDGKIHVSPEEWFACLSTNLQLLGAGQTLIPYPTESEDGTQLYAVVSTSGMLAVFSFQDAEGNTLTTGQKDARNLIHNIRVDAQFTNDTAKEFLMLLMIIAINNNAALTYENANTLCTETMRGNRVSDNSFLYVMEIISAEDHTVCVSITAE